MKSVRRSLPRRADAVEGFGPSPTATCVCSTCWTPCQRLRCAFGVPRKAQPKVQPQPLTSFFLLKAEIIVARPQRYGLG